MLESLMQKQSVSNLIPSYVNTLYLNPTSVRRRFIFLFKQRQFFVRDRNPFGALTSCTFRNFRSKLHSQQYSLVFETTSAIFECRNMKNLSVCCHICRFSVKLSEWITKSSTNPGAIIALNFVELVYNRRIFAIFEDLQGSKKKVDLHSHNGEHLLPCTGKRTYCQSLVKDFRSYGSCQGCDAGGRKLQRVFPMYRESETCFGRASGQKNKHAMALEPLDTQLQRACKVIKRYKSGSRLQLLLSCRGLLQEMQEITKEIANCLARMSLASLDISLEIRDKTNSVGETMRRLEFRPARQTEAIVLKIEDAIKGKQNHTQHIIELLLQIAKLTGVSMNASFVEKEREEMESRKKEAEALQLSQIIDFLCSSEMVTQAPSPSSQSLVNCSEFEGSMNGNGNQGSGNQVQQHPLKPFTCPLSNEIMKDPVSLVSGHTFEREAIVEYFTKGNRRCSVSGQELESFELKPNLALRNSIKEWKERNIEYRLRTATSNISSTNFDEVNHALQDLDSLMEKPRNRTLIAEKGLIPTIVHALKTSDRSINTYTALKCLCYLAKDSDQNKEAIVNAGAINCTIALLAGEEESDHALSLLLELSQNMAISERIGNTKSCIPFLVALLNSQNSQASQKAEALLDNLSSITNFVIKMAKANYFKPFIQQIAEGTISTKISLATTFSNIKLNYPNREAFEAFAQPTFVNSLIHMTFENSLECRLASLNAMLVLSRVSNIVEQLLSGNTLVPSLLRLIDTASPESHLKEKAAEILANLVEACKASELHGNPQLHELQSRQTISSFVGLIGMLDPLTKIHLLRLLFGLATKSQAVREVIRSIGGAISLLASLLQGHRPQVRLHAVNLLFCLMEENASEIELTKHLKDTGMKTLVMIIASSPNEEEKAAALGILSRLPTSDPKLAEMLQKSEALNVIFLVISAKDLQIKPSRENNNSLLENALGALLHFTSPSNSELQSQVAELEILPLLVGILLTGSLLAKERAAIALGQLSQTTLRKTAVILPNNKWPFRTNSYLVLQPTRILPNWCCKQTLDYNVLCSVHRQDCSDKKSFCLVKANALEPLVNTVWETSSGASEAALGALDTLLQEVIVEFGAEAIAELQGVPAILQVLEKGTLPAKQKGIEMLEKILKDPKKLGTHGNGARKVLIELLQQGTPDVKKKAAGILNQMDVLPTQSSYF